MGVVVIPGRFIAPSDDIGRLVNTMLGVVLAGAVERQRLQRARQLQADGAVLRLEPEPEFAAHATPASGRTDATGRVAARAEGDLSGVPPGLYRVVVEHERLAKLPRYNSATILGIQVAPDDPGMMTLSIDLKSSPR